MTFIYNGKEYNDFYDLVDPDNMKTSRYSECETQEEIAEVWEEHMQELLEQDEEFMKEFPDPLYAHLRIAYLKDNMWEEAGMMFVRGELIPHLMQTQKEGFAMMERLMKIAAQRDGITKGHPLYYTTISQINEMVIKEVVEK